MKRLAFLIVLLFAPVVSSFAQGVQNQYGIGYGAAYSSPLYCFSHVASSLTNTTTETTLFSCSIVRGTMGPNSTIRITDKWSFPNTVSTKTFRIKMDGSTVRNVSLGSGTVAWVDQTTGQNRNSYSAQLWTNSANSGSFTYYGIGLVTTTLDTTATQTILLTGQTTSLGETITLESVDIEILN